MYKNEIYIHLTIYMHGIPVCALKILWISTSDKSSKALVFASCSLLGYRYAFYTQCIGCG